MGAIAADAVGSHDGTDDDGQGAEDEEGNGEGDLFDGGAVLDGAAGVAHHDVLVGDREGVVDVRHGWPPPTSTKDEGFFEKRGAD